jgi:hypothetical protein
MREKLERPARIILDKPDVLLLWIKGDTIDGRFRPSHPDKRTSPACRPEQRATRLASDLGMKDHHCKFTA